MADYTYDSGGTQTPPGSTLEAIAALAPDANTIIMGDGSTWVVGTIGADIQAYAATLASWSAITRAAGFDTFTATPSSANLRGLLTDETGTGAAVFATSPTLTTPTVAGLIDHIGGQIAFPATQVPSSGANTLDDYEEGTSTPTVTASSGTLTTATAALVYTKIGRLVTFSCRITITNAGTGSADLQFVLPFAAAAINGNGGGSGREIASTGYQCSLTIGSSATYGIVVLYSGVTVIATGRIIDVSGIYYV